MFPVSLWLYFMLHRENYTLRMHNKKNVSVTLSASFRTHVDSCQKNPFISWNHDIMSFLFLFIHESAYAYACNKEMQSNFSPVSLSRCAKGEKNNNLFKVKKLKVSAVWFGHNTVSWREVTDTYHVHD